MISDKARQAAAFRLREWKLTGNKWQNSQSTIKLPYPNLLPIVNDPYYKAIHQYG